MMYTEDIVSLISMNLHLITISCFGGLVLFGFKLTEYLNRTPEEKIESTRAVIIYALLFFCLPLLGAAVSIIYIINGDKMGAVLAFQVGLTSPAIAQGMAISAANKVANDPVQVASDA